MDMPSDLVSCPFDSNHAVSRRKLQYHIVKCQKTYAGRKIPCPYNASEYVLPEELMSHLSTCASMAERLSHSFPLECESEGIREMAVAPYYHPELPEATERWGLE